MEVADSTVVGENVGDEKFSDVQWRPKIKYLK